MPVGEVAAERDQLPHLTAQMDWDFQRHGYHPLSVDSDNKNASTSNEKVEAVINILDFGVFEGLALKAKNPEADPKLDQPSGYSIFMRKMRSGYIPLLLLCGDFEKKVSIAKQTKTNSEADICSLYSDF